MNETIGLVKLNDTFYRGVDRYSDGPVEEKLLQLVQRDEPCTDKELCASWPVYYHLSPVRTNLISWLPIRHDQAVLEIGAGCGALTGILAKKAGLVHGIELSRRRNLINAWRHRTLNNIELFTGNFEDIELPQLYDWITLVGVFEYAGSFISGEEPWLNLLQAAHRLLKPGGRLILAIENKFGLKYWAGCREDHSGRLFESLEGYPYNGQVRTFSRRELANLLTRSAYGASTFYYPFPDYKTPAAIYSDACLPRIGQLRSMVANYDQNRLYLFNEGMVWDQLTQENLVGFFANSFLVISDRDGEGQLG